MKARFSLVFLMLFSTIQWCKGQTPLDEQSYIKQLEATVKTAKTDSIRSRANFELSKYWALKDSLQSAKYLEAGKQFGRNTPYLQVLYYYYQAFLFARNDLDLGAKNYRKVDSLLLNYHQKEASLFRAKAWYEYGIIQIKKDNFKEAADIVLNTAIPLAEKAGSKTFTGTSYLLLANIFKNGGQYDKAEIYCLKSIQILKRIDSSGLVSAYTTIAENYTMSGKFRQAKSALDDARKILTPYPESEHLLDYYAAEGLYFTTIDQFKKALISANKGIILAKKLNIPYKEQRLLLQKFYACYYLKDFEGAKKILIFLMKQPIMVKMSVNRLQLYHGMAITYHGMGKMELAYNWLKRYSELSDSVSQSTLKNDVNALEVKYKNAEKQKEINELKANNIQSSLSAENNRLLNWLLGSVSIFSLIAAMFSLLYYRNKRKLLIQKELSYQQHLNELEQQQQLQFSQAMLQGEEQERRRLARDLHDGLGGMLAGVKINLSGQMETPSGKNQKVNLLKVIGQLDSSVTELRRIAHNMMPVNLLNFGLKTALKDLCETMMTSTSHIDFQALAIDDPMPEQTQINIYRIVQEILANAIRHSGATNILLQCSRNGAVFFITQEDNGKGFDINSAQIETGIGISNIRNRVGFLKGKMEIESETNRGTVINIELHVGE